MPNMNRRPSNPANFSGARAYFSEKGTNSMSSIIFPPANESEPAAPRASRVELTSTSIDHPLYPQGMTAPQGMTGSWTGDPMQSRRPAPVSRPSGMAGRSSIKSLSVRNVLAGSDEAGPGVVPDAAPRHQYQHPTYHISRSSRDTGTKELLYGAPAPAPAQRRAPSGAPSGGTPASQGAPTTVDPELRELHAAYLRLSAAIPAAPRDAEGNADEQSVHGALAAEGMNISSEPAASLSGAAPHTHRTASPQQPPHRLAAASDKVWYKSSLVPRTEVLGQRRRMLVNARHSWVGDACLARGEDAPGQTPGAQTPREIGAGAMTVSAPPTHHGGACALSETP